MSEEELAETQADLAFLLDMRDRFVTKPNHDWQECAISCQVMVDQIKRKLAQRLDV